MKPVTQFPQPHKLGASANKWALSELLQFEAARTGQEPPTLAPADERWLSTTDVCKRLGVGRTTLWRWVRDSAEVAS